MTGLEIYKQLPKKNCGECGPPTCLAFAMALAAGKASLEACPYVSEAAREALASAAAPPIRLVKVGPDSKAIELGDETVIFRHEKTFVHPTAIAIEVGDDLPEAELSARLQKVASLTLERVGQTYRPDMVAVVFRSGDPARFKAAVAKAAQTELGLMLSADDPAVMAEAVEPVAVRRPLIYPATAQNAEAMVELAKKHGLPLGVRAQGLDGLATLVEKIVGLGHRDLVLDPGRPEASARLADFTQIRRLAIKKRFRPLGYPTLAFTAAADPGDEILEAAGLVARYCSLVVLKACERHQLLPLLTWRQNVFTDPQKPIQVQSRLYTVGQVTPASPFYVTTNFSLTYFSVEGEVEASKVPAYILPVDTDGTSVLTSWAAGKFTGESIAEAMKKSGIEEKVQHREVVIPGHVAVLSGKLQEASGWKVVVGPREASGIPSFARSRYGAPRA
ncbi:MAG: acetyl-CoA decarbonylase/synthase complex subunit gamma [Acetobacteraceae bacterium]|nr:acetyl-CoA decarbonylase/synthase complex subunit gamma [Acetobacteraceae bacterium]